MVGPGLSTFEYAHLCEVMGKYLLTAEATNCSAPDTGNMEVASRIGYGLAQCKPTKECNLHFLDECCLTELQIDRFIVVMS